MSVGPASATIFLIHLSMYLTKNPGILGKEEMAPEKAVVDMHKYLDCIFLSEILRFLVKSQNSSLRGKYAICQWEYLTLLLLLPLSSFFFLH